MKNQVRKHRIDRRLITSRTYGRWKLSHFHHTGRSLPHSHTSYPVLAMIMLCVGVLIAGVGQSALALTFTESRDIEVSARLLGPAPTVAATIDSPLEGTKFTAKPITVTGTCPTDTYIVLVRNGIDSGMAICQADNTYSLETDLFTGNNALQAQVYNTTNVAGPISGTVTVSYNLPVTNPPVKPPTEADVMPQPATPAQSPSSAATPAPLILSTKFQYLGHSVGQLIEYNFAVSGGQAPYAVLADWGDGSQKLITVPMAGSFTMTHSYQTTGGFKGSYPIKITLTDATGDATSLQIVTIIKDQLGVGVASSSPADKNSVLPGDQRGIFTYIWTVYGLIVLMLVAFWLGEQRELRLLRPHSRRIGHA